jgi:hypothetical protein
MRTIILVLAVVIISAGFKARAQTGNTLPDVDRMQQVYEEVKTTYKYGVILRGEKGAAVDCPSVFRKGDRWYMVYICMNKKGYETSLDFMLPLSK